MQDKSQKYMSHQLYVNYAYIFHKQIIKGKIKKKTEKGRRKRKEQKKKRGVYKA